MKKRLMKVLSILTVLAMLAAFLPAALSEGSEADVQEAPVLSEAPAAEAPAPAAAEEEPAPAPAEEPVPAPAAAEESAPAPAAAEEPAPAPEAMEEPDPAPADEEPAPAEDEEEAPASAADEEEPAPEEDGEPAIEAEEEQPAPAAGKEPADPDTENEEPVVLNVGETLSGTVFAGKELKIRLQSENAGTIALTLTMNAGKEISARINDTDAGFAGVETGDAEKAVYTCEIHAGEDACYMVTFSAETDTDFSLETESRTDEKTEEPAAEKLADSEPAAAENIHAEPADRPVEENDPEEETDADADQAENGYVRVMVIRENGTNLYNSTDPDAEAVGKLNHGDIYWIKAVGGIWGEIVTEDGNDPLYLNLNNVVLLRGEAGYDIPIRTVRLVSTLDGLTEIEEGTEVTITAEFSGFMEDEIADITWQYRSGEEEDFRTVDDAAGLVYTYAVTEENIHNEWRIVLTLRS